MSYTNLLQKLAIALSEGKADAKVEYVPLSRTPYVKIAMDADFEKMDDLRNKILMEIASRGFRLVNASQLVKEGDSGFQIISIGEPLFDFVGGMAVITASDDGCYAVKQNLSTGNRNREASKKDFDASVAEKKSALFWSRQGKERMIMLLLRRAPFKIETVDTLTIMRAPDIEVLDRVATAFAQQDLKGFEDLVREAQLEDLLNLPASSAFRAK